MKRSFNKFRLKISNRKSYQPATIVKSYTFFTFCEENHILNFLLAISLISKVQTHLYTGPCGLTASTSPNSISLKGMLHSHKDFG